MIGGYTKRQEVTPGYTDVTPKCNRPQSRARQCLYIYKYISYIILFTCSHMQACGRARMTRGRTHATYGKQNNVTAKMGGVKCVLHGLYAVTLKNVTFRILMILGLSW